MINSRGESSYNLNIYLLLLVIVFTCISNSSCNKNDESVLSHSTLFTLLSTAQSGIEFQNFVNESVDRGIANYEYFYNGSGVAIGDINNDELPDIFFTGSDTDNALYLNKGDLKFDDISNESGIRSGKWSTGVTMVDINNDGLLDIYVCNSGPSDKADDMKNQLFINLGKNKFEEQAAAYGIDDHSRSTHATFFDMDNDGDLDLWVANHGLRKRGVGTEEWFQLANRLSSSDYQRECSTLYRNDGNGTFTDISREAGIAKIGFGLGISVNDFDSNGFLDVYITNDYFIPDFMFLNNGDGTFTDSASKKLGHTSYYAMGCDAADINNDGLTDLAVVDMTPSDHVRNKVLMASMDVTTFDYLTINKAYTPQYMMNSLYINNGFGIMSDVGLYAGVSQTDWSWAPLLIDLDNDGYKDLIVTNGYKKDTKNNDWQIELRKIIETKGTDFSEADYFEHLKKADVTPVPNSIFRNVDGLKFEDKVTDWGFATPSFSNGAAYGDLDRDGDLDLVINNFDQEAFVYKNETIENGESNFLQVKLKDGTSASAAMYATVNIYYDDQMQSADFATSRGFQSSVEPLIHFGLGEVTKVDRMEVFWPDGQKSTISEPTIDKVHTIEKSSTLLTPISKGKIVPLFANLSKSYLHPPFEHKENKFNDFAKEILLPHRQSTIGPSTAVGDVNGDGTEDFYVGGAFGQAGALYLQDNNGHFNLKNIPAFASDAKHEDTGAKFIDIDSDNDLDLYVASGGGGDLEGKEKLLQDRLYINDGQGTFVASKSALPKINSSTKAIAEVDIDSDGDLDIFIGGRTTPGQYPLAPESYLLINDNGTFTNQIAELAPELASIGMVSDALWSDTDNDGKKDLLVVGEWMPISLFKNTESALKNTTDAMGLGKTNGWWASIGKGDIDGDGDEDIVVGNIGLNNKFHPNEEKPLYVYANDFDKNDQLDIVLSKMYKGTQVPVRGRECSSQQMPFITEKYPTYEGFATANLVDIYEEEQLASAVKYEATQFASVILMNDGQGKFELRELPKEAQLAPINGIIVKDFDKDNKLDLIVGGNLKQTEVETPLYDAGKGLFLKGNGDGTFSTDLQIENTGLFLHQDVRDLKLIHIGPNKRPAFLVCNNNTKMELIVYRH